MKRLFTLFSVLFVFALFAASSALAGDTNAVTIADGETAVAAGHSYSPVTINTEGLEGFFALQGQIEGGGAARIEYQTSADGAAFTEPQGARDIIEGFTATSGPASDGRFYVQFEPDFCRYLRIVITETGGVSSITPTVTLLKR